MRNLINLFKKRYKFITLASLLVVFTVFLANHFALILFGNNSLEVYDALKYKKDYLKKEIDRLQHENAKLQKEYFELKNLEPEE